MSNGYPSDDEIKAIDDFYGYPLDFVRYIGSIWRNGAGWEIEERPDTWGGVERVATFVTGGWSGCEEIMGRVTDNTIFSFLFYNKWERGGLHEFVIGQAQLEMQMNWGRKIGAGDE